MPISRKVAIGFWHFLYLKWTIFYADSDKLIKLEVHRKIKKTPQAFSIYLTESNPSHFVKNLKNHILWQIANPISQILCRDLGDNVVE